MYSLSFLIVELEAARTKLLDAFEVDQQSRKIIGSKINQWFEQLKKDGKSKDALWTSERRAKMSALTQSPYCVAKGGTPSARMTGGGFHLPVSASDLGA
jgi:hypothetical protein